MLENELEDQIQKPGGKLEDINTDNEKFQTQPYLTNLTLDEAITKFKLRSKMLEVKDHILFCPAYIELRKDKDINSDKDLVNYVRQVMILSDDLKKKVYWEEKILINPATR